MVLSNPVTVRGAESLAAVIGVFDVQIVGNTICNIGKSQLILAFDGTISTKGFESIDHRVGKVRAGYSNRLAITAFSSSLVPLDREFVSHIGHAVSDKGCQSGCPDSVDKGRPSSGRDTALVGFILFHQLFDLRLDGAGKLALYLGKVIESRLAS